MHSCKYSRLCPGRLCTERCAQAPRRLLSIRDGDGDNHNRRWVLWLALAPFISSIARHIMHDTLSSPRFYFHTHIYAIVTLNVSCLPFLFGQHHYISDFSALYWKSACVIGSIKMDVLEVNASFRWVWAGTTTAVTIAIVSLNHHLDRSMWVVSVIEDELTAFENTHKRRAMKNLTMKEERIQWQYTF